jgi:hypothetical protein
LCTRVFAPYLFCEANILPPQISPAYGARLSGLNFAHGNFLSYSNVIHRMTYPSFHCQEKAESWVVKSARYDRQGYEAHVPCSLRPQEEIGISCRLGRTKCGSDMRGVLTCRFDEISKRGHKIRSEIFGSAGTRTLSVLPMVALGKMRP